MWRLFYPLRYFALQNSGKRHIDVWPTLFLTLLIGTPFVLLPDAPFFRSGGFLDKLLLLTSALTGFYVAALVAAATFVHDDLDKVITLGAIELPMQIDGKKVLTPLTRREFACTIFGYLAFSALMLSLLSGLAISLSGASHRPLENLPVVGALFVPSHFILVRDVFIYLFSAAVSHLAVVTSLGLYYLMDRLYRHEPVVLTEKKNKRVA
jgi:hypothetical protein